MSLPVLVQSNSEQHLYLLKPTVCSSFGHTWKDHVESGHNSAFRGVSEKLRLIYVRAVDNVYWQKAFLVKN